MSSDIPTAPLHAWVDESVHVGNRLYLMAAAIAPCDELQLEACRQRLRSLVRHARGRLHWSDEEERDLVAIADTIATLPVTNVVVTAARLDPKRQERARRKCMEQLLHRLATDGVRHVWLESRDAIGNTRDLTMVATMRSAHSLPPTIRVDHARPLNEPMLWVPDAVVGAVAASHNGQPHYRAPMVHMIEEINFDL